MICESPVNFMWIIKRLKRVLIYLWITFDLSFSFVDFIHIVMNRTTLGFITVIRAFTQTHSPYY